MTNLSIKPEAATFKKGNLIIPSRVLKHGRKYSVLSYLNGSATRPNEEKFIILQNKQISFL